MDEIIRIDYKKHEYSEQNRSNILNRSDTAVIYLCTSNDNRNIYLNCKRYQVNNLIDAFNHIDSD